MGWNIRRGQVRACWFTGICLFYCLRFLYLDADSRPYLLNQIQPIDEMYYNEIAVNIYNMGIKDFITYGVGDPTIPNAKCYLFSNVVTGVSLSILGKNYYALRVQSVVLGFLGMLLVGVAVRTACRKFEKRGVLALLAMSIYVLDFNILAYTRSAITIGPCILAEIVMVWLAVRYADEEARQIFWLSFCSLLSFCTVYMGVSFFVLAVGIWTAFAAIKALGDKRKVKRILLAYLSGNLSAFAMSEALSFAFLREHTWDVVLGTFTGFGYTIREKVGLLSSLGTWLSNASSFWMSNMFRYNPILLMLFASSVIIWILYYRGRREAQFLLLLIGSHWLQMTVLVNANESKSTISYGAVLIFMMFILGTFVLEGRWKSMGFWPGLAIAMSGLLSVCLSWLSYRYVSHAFSPVVLRWGIFLLTAIAFAIWGTACLARRKAYVFGILFMAFLINTSLLSAKYVYLGNTYDDRDMCIKVGNVAGSAATIGGFPLGCVLYNDTEPVFSTYDRYTEHGMDIGYVDGMYARLVNEYEELYYIGYAREISRLNDVLLAGTGYYFEEVCYFPRTYYAYNEHDADMGIYVKRPKGEP